ncbi:MAG TPA: chemotaxis protein CheX [candidate division Zixibacteria bacterium]|nr:chemotaxis protein CheX [candidate division Zixibacteria bacterium]
MNKLLFVSDMVLNSQTVRKFLKGIMEVRVAANPTPEDILEADIIVCDMESDPRLMAAQVHSLRAQCGFRDVPIIVASHRSHARHAKDTLQSGATEVIFKPFDGENFVKRVVNALKPVGKRVKIDNDMVMPFISATIDVIETTTQATAKRTDLFLKRSYTVFGDVTGMMALSGECEGVVAITFKQDLAFKLVAKMADCDETELTAADVHDGIGEIINMISGKAKTSLQETEYKFNISLSTVVLGHGHQIAHRHNAPVIVIVFEADGQPFAVQLCLAPIHRSHKPVGDQDITASEPTPVS